MRRTTIVLKSIMVVVKKLLTWNSRVWSIDYNHHNMTTAIVSLLQPLSKYANIICRGVLSSHHDYYAHHGHAGCTKVVAMWQSLQIFMYNCNFLPFSLNWAIILLKTKLTFNCEFCQEKNTCKWHKNSQNIIPKVVYQPLTTTTIDKRKSSKFTFLIVSN